MGGECSGAASLGIRQHLLHDASAWSPSFPLRTLLVGVEVGGEEGRGGVLEVWRRASGGWREGGRVERLLSALKSPPPDHLQNCSLV